MYTVAFLTAMIRNIVQYIYGVQLTTAYSVVCMFSMQYCTNASTWCLDHLALKAFKSINSCPPLIFPSLSLQMLWWSDHWLLCTQWGALREAYGGWLATSSSSRVHGIPMVTHVYITRVYITCEFVEITEYVMYKFACRTAVQWKCDMCKIYLIVWAAHAK